MNQQMATGERWYGVPPRFDPEAGQTVAEPPGTGYGYWSGASSASYDSRTNRFGKVGGVCFEGSPFRGAPSH